MLTHQWICLNELYKLMKSSFQSCYRIIGRKQKNIQTNSEAGILIKVLCIIHQWIRLYKLNKIMESSFQISESFFKLNFFENNSGVGFIYASEEEAF